MQKLIIQICVLLFLALPGRLLIASDASAIPAGSGTYAQMVTLHDEFLRWLDPEELIPSQIIRDVAGHSIDPVMIYSQQTVSRRLCDLEGFMSQLADMNVVTWERNEQVDFLAVRARVLQEIFMLKVVKPWQRDPGFYVDQMLRLTFTELPVADDQVESLLRKLRTVPVLVERAKAQLTNIAGDYADLALHNLASPDGVGHGFPFREQPPAGVIGWYDDLLARAKEQPELLVDIQVARTAVADLHNWLIEQRPGLSAKAGVGKPAFDWYIKYVKLLPWNSDELIVLGQREHERFWANYTFERIRNEALPELEPAVSATEYQSRIDATDTHIREFLQSRQIITIPDDIGILDTNVPWTNRPDGRNFWEEVQFRDPHPDHLHAVIPGHRFDGVMASRSTHPLRSKLYSPVRVEGWATYLEEAMLRAGMFDDMPRVRELIHIFGIFRGARVAADVWLQTREMSVQQVVDYWMERVPYLDENVARVDAEIYLRRPPGYGLGYTIGALQLQQLLAERKRQLGEEFSLRKFHDRLMTAGRLHLSLLRWEMTGFSDEVDEFWALNPIPETVETP